MTAVGAVGRIDRRVPRRRPGAGAVGLVVGLVIVVAVLLAGWLLPLRYNPDAISSSVLQAPGHGHLFGTDEAGGDVFARTVRAARTDLPLALAGTALALVVGVIGGLLASEKGKWGERFMRGLDAFQSLPLLVLTVALVVISGNSLTMVVVAIVLISGPFFIRLVRSQALTLRESRFVEAAVAAGASPSRVMVRHLLPNLRALILAQTALTAANALLVIAALSFIGVGIQPPTPSWGAMIRTGAGLVTTGQWWLALFPALGIFACVLSFNLIADGLRDRSAGRRNGAEMSESAAMALLDVDNLSVSYGRGAHALRAVHGVSFCLDAGRRYGVVGETGCGKSSVLKAVLGLVRTPHRAWADRLVLDGAGDLLRLAPRRLRAVRGAEIGFVAQNPFGALHPVLTVGEQFHRFLHAHRATSGRADSRLRATSLLGRLGIPDPERVYDGHAGVLSGGMAQRVVIAFASILEPRLVVADEPTTALDVTVQRQVLDLIAAPDLSRTLLMTTHDLSVVAQFCDEVFVMYAGRIIESGPVAKVFVTPEHPYTRALLGSVPRPGHPLASLAGAPPPLGEHGSGCAFAPRCDRSSTLCTERPTLISVAPVAPVAPVAMSAGEPDGEADQGTNHEVACHHAMTGSAV